MDRLLSAAEVRPLPLGEGTRRLTVLLALICPGTHAMGPQAPFVPPNHAVVLASAADPNAQALASRGLSAVRLGSRPQALIDGLWVGPGQPVRGGLLLRLTPNHVVLQMPDGRTEHLPLFTPPPEQPASAAAGAGSSAEPISPEKAPS
jgi:hypothetical protein